GGSAPSAGTRRRACCGPGRILAGARPTPPAADAILCIRSRTYGNGCTRSESGQTQTTPVQPAGSAMDSLPPPSTTVPGADERPWLAFTNVTLREIVMLLPALVAVCRPSLTVRPSRSVRPAGLKPLRKKMLPLMLTVGAPVKVLLLNRTPAAPLLLNVLLEI